MWRCLSTLEKGRGYEAPEAILQNYYGKQDSSAGIPANLRNEFAEIFICLNSSLLPLDGSRNEEGA